MDYTNPIIFQDFSDPDVIRVKDSYYMIASSFNHAPGIPVLKSKNLVDWKLIHYAMDELPFERFKDVRHGEGVWAPSLRFHKGVYYICIPFPDDGIYVCSCTDIDKGNWTKPWCLIAGKGYEDPCPIWLGDKCYLVLAFAKSRAGFNSCLGLYEVTPDLKNTISESYTIIYDGHNMSPTIEGPKFNARNGWIYIMAPAGSVKTGWQVCLRSKNIYGPYEAKIVLLQNDTKINGPHQGALINLKKDAWAFIHFQDLDCYGRIVHLQPVKWVNDWPICGYAPDELLAGSPVSKHEYLIDKDSNFKLETSDLFQKDKLSLIWQTPANKQLSWYTLSKGLVLSCYCHNTKAYRALHLTPNLFLTKLSFPSFKASALCELKLMENGDEAGLCFMGTDYSYICIRRIQNQNHLQIRRGAFNQEEDVVLFDCVYQNKEIEFIVKFQYPGLYQLGFNKTIFKEVYEATKGRWIGGKVGIYARSNHDSVGFARFKYYKVKAVKKREGKR
ncbi:MAG: glycosyl hydrolase 43 family protein [Acholeplasmatales bacterium]|jgi:beta-xylosidase|nr:glycosyl hydrolase 43 family protein [Acholeplasmatales bacterium]